MKFVKTFLLALCICVIMLPAAETAAKSDKAHGKGQGQGAWHKKDDVIWNENGGQGRSGQDVQILRDYVIGHYSRNCPPGLAKKNPPCVPPGQAKKYGAGAILPEGAFVPVPGDIVARLAPPPRHARYVRVDRDVYLITEGTRKVLEAIELFSAVE